jgi:simple sugar transport system permease protein
MLVGAFAGALVSSVANNLGAGIVAALIAGGLFGALLAVFAIAFYVNQVVLGVVLNLLALGLTGYLYDALMQNNSQTYNTGLGLAQHKIPLLGDIPILGTALFNANWIVYAMYVLLIVINVALFRTRWGLRTRAVGEHPRAAATVGIKVRWTRYRNVVLGGMIAGLGGSFLTIGTATAFQKNPVGMTSGKGYIALAALIFGRWSPTGALGAALLFGLASELQPLLSGSTPVNIPSDFWLALPYLATLLAVAGIVGRVVAPAADGEPYTG